VAVGAKALSSLFGSGMPAQPKKRGKQPKQSMKRDRRAERAAIVRKVMRDLGVDLPTASHYVKEHRLFE